MFVDKGVFVRVPVCYALVAIIAAIGGPMGTFVFVRVPVCYALVAIAAIG